MTLWSSLSAESESPPVKGIAKLVKSQVRPQLRRNSFATHLTIEDGCKSDANGCSKADAGKNKKAQN